MGIRVSQLLDDLNLEIVHMGEENSLIESGDLNRPGLQLSGYFEHFAWERVQIIGRVEWSYISHLSSEDREKSLEKIFSYKFPCIIVTRGLEIFPELIMLAAKYGRTLARTDMATTRFISRIINYLDEKLAQSISLHGVLVDVYGIGVLINGKSGVGKSETALELVKRGHRLVSDDMVIVRKINSNLLIGSSPELTKHYIEIRGLGILDVKSLFGTSSVMDVKDVELVITLENWQEGKGYERLGMEDTKTEILEVKLPHVLLPVIPGRNLAVIIEAAAINHRYKSMGHNTAIELSNKIMSNRFTS